MEGRKSNIYIVTDGRKEGLEEHTVTEMEGRTTYIDAHEGRRDWTIVTLSVTDERKEGQQSHIQ